MPVFSFAPISGIFMVFVAPLLIGNFFVKKDEYFVFGGFRYATGLVSMLSIFLPFEAIALRRRTSFTRMCNYYTITLLGLCIISLLVFFYRKQYKRMFKGNVIRYLFENKCLFILFGFILFSTVRNVAFTRIGYSDDASYTTAAIDMICSDRLFCLDQTTAEWITGDILYKYQHMSIIAFYVFFAKAFGVHPAVLIHTLSPIVWTPMVFIILWKMSGEIYREKVDVGKRVLCIMVVWLMFETISSTKNTSLAIYFYSGIWWGKSFVQLIAIPLFISVFFSTWGRKLDIQDCLLWTSVSLAANAASLMGAILMPFVIMGMGVVYMFKKKTLDRLMPCAICCIPCFISIIDALSITGKI